jgi:pimeloyl-CoA synthetase
LANIKNVQSFLNKNIDDNGIWKTLNVKIERLKENIESIWKDTFKQEEFIDKKYQKEIDNIYENIKMVKENRRIYKSNYENNRKIFESAIDEALSLIK